MAYFQIPNLSGFLLLALLLVPPAFAADDDLPPPAEGGTEEIPATEPPPQPEFGEEIPSPSLGDDLPAPAAGREGESEANKVNKYEEPDNIFLPAPGASDYSGAPLSNPMPVYSNNAYSATSWESGMDRRPVFSLSLGPAFRSYPSTLVEETKTGYAFGASYRAMSLGQTAFLHLMAGLSFFQIGTVQGYTNLKDQTLHLGVAAEIGIGRRMSIFGTLLRRSNYLTSAPLEPGQNRRATDPLRQGQPELQYIGEEAAIRPGLGFLYDFYVVPHGSLGVMARVEQDLAIVMLSMAIEPAPRKKMDLNFDSFIK